MAKAIINGQTIFGNVHLGSGAGGKETLFEGSSSTSQWSNPIVIERDCSAFDVLDLSAVQDSDISQLIRVADIPQNSSPSSISDYLQITTRVYIRLNDSGFLYLYVDSNYTLTVSKIVGYK